MHIIKTKSDVILILNDNVKFTNQMANHFPYKP